MENIIKYMLISLIKWQYWSPYRNIMRYYPLFTHTHYRVLVTSYQEPWITSAVTPSLSVLISPSFQQRCASDPWHATLEAYIPLVLKLPVCLWLQCSWMFRRLWMHHVNGLTCFNLMVNLIYILGKHKKLLEAKIFRIWLETNPYSMISSVGVRK